MGASVISEGDSITTAAPDKLAVGGIWDPGCAAVTWVGNWGGEPSTDRRVGAARPPRSLDSNTLVIQDNLERTVA